MFSQRENGFNGGIQNGFCATDKDAKNLDQCLKSIRDELLEELVSTGYQMSKKITRETLEQINVHIGFEPDGGLWFKNGVLHAAFEGKKQGKGGNAIERWQKNHWIATRINPNVKYVTFAIGEGFSESCYPYRYALTMLESENKVFNTLYPKSQSWFINPDGFDRKEIYDIMKKTLEIDNK